MGKIPRRRDRLPTPIFLGFPDGSDGKEAACSVGRPVFNPWARRISWKREWLLTPVFLLENPHRRSRLVGYSPLGLTDSDTAEHLSTTQQVRTDHQCTQKNLKIRQVCREMLLPALPAFHIFTVRMHTFT